MSIPDEHSVRHASGNAEGSLEAETPRLARLICAHTPHDGGLNLPIPGLYVNRYSQTDANWVNSIFNFPLLLIVAQGAKAVTVGQEVYRIGSSRMLIFPVALPVALQTTQASYSKPFLSVGLNLDAQRITELVPKVYPQGLPPVRQWRASYVTSADLSIVNAVTRILECLHNPSDVELLAPLVMDEILIRLLRSPIGVRVAEMGFADSCVQQVAKAVAWLLDNFSQQMKIADLAELAHMSVSSFNEHFKAVTSMSPLQYQKALRLQEARRLMLSRQMDATTACRLVGYVSDSQFSRDYSRFFRNPPRRDIARMRQQTHIPG
ncbi:DNA-binding domain-containing protein, AraC-type [Candidatus Desulfosporosinus infrequens]|uniref:DNA-binding domain-containing protein, AraC-type n=1 Tax=Candidatus Desulfosporosinus infrequens TaxID=2043169 RepID=A0A2U3LBW9_9FIRM|nr:DNA-binding domain-containing protein, AraC-type [Candidatus Desulfosporosinus infrequens]